MYGCCLSSLEHQSTKTNELIRLLPFLIQERNKLFSYKNCSFACEREKENTARIVLFKEMGITNSYTLEASFYGGEWLAKVVYEEESLDEEEDEQEPENYEQDQDEDEQKQEDDQDQDQESEEEEDEDEDPEDEPEPHSAFTEVENLKQK